MLKLWLICSGLSFGATVIAHSTGQGTMTVIFFAFVSAVFLILAIVGDKP